MNEISKAVSTNDRLFLPLPKGRLKVEGTKFTKFFLTPGFVFDYAVAGGLTLINIDFAK